MSDITVSSTTDTQQAVEQAAGLEPETVPAAEPEESPAQPDSADQPESPAESETSTENTSELQQRLNALNRRLEKQEEQLKALRAARSNPEPQNPPAATPPGPRPKPNVKDTTPDGKTLKYSSYEDYIEDLADWKAEQRLTNARQAEAAHAENNRVQAVRETFDHAVDQARAKYHDFDEVVARRGAEIPPAAKVAIFEAGEMGAEIAYYLGQHPELCAELATINPMRAAARIGQIEAQLQAQLGTGRPHEAGKTSTAASSRNGTPAREALSSNAPSQKRPTTSAPAPINPVGGSSTKSTIPVDELSYRDYRRLRDKEEGENRRR